MLAKKRVISLVIISFALIVLISCFSSAGIFEWLKSITGEASQSQPVSLTINISNVAPTITIVDNVTAFDLTEDGYKAITINTVINDGDNNSDIRTVFGNLTAPGEINRTGVACTAGPVNSYTSINYSCAFNMAYFEFAGSWSIAIWANDSVNNLASNITQNITINSLKGIVTFPSTLTWGNIARAATNQTPTNSPLTINNTGNYNAKNISVNSTDVVGDSDGAYGLWANNFTVATVNGTAALLECQGSTTTGTTLMTNAAYTNISGSALNKANRTNAGTVGQEQLFFCLRTVGSELISQQYSTTTKGSWTVKMV